MRAAWAIRGSSPCASTPRTRRPAWARPDAGAAGDRRHGLLPRRGRRGARGGGRAGARRDHRARSLPLPVPRGERVPPRDLARLPAPRHRAAPGRRPDRRTVHYMETLAGDTTVGHATAYCHAVEALAGSQAPRARPRRSAASRWSSSGWRTTSAISARSRATSGSCPRPSYCGRIRGDYLNMTRAPVREPIRPRPDVASRRRALRRRPARCGTACSSGSSAAERDTAEAVNLLWDSSSVMARFEDAGRCHARRSRARSGWWGRRPAPAASSRDVRTRLSRRASTGSATCRSPRGAPATCSRARTSAGSRSSSRSASSASSSRRCRRARSQARAPGAARREHRWCRSSRAGEARSATSRSPTRTGGSAATRSSIRRSTTGSGLAMALRGPADLRLPAVQQELQPVLLRARPVGVADAGAILIELGRSARAIARCRIPTAPPPELPERFRGRPEIDAGQCPDGCRACAEACPTQAITSDGVGADRPGPLPLLHRLRARPAPRARSPSRQDYRLAVRHARGSRGPRRSGRAPARRGARARELRRLFGRSLKLRQVSAGGCNGCELDVNVLEHGGVGPGALRRSSSWRPRATPTACSSPARSPRT